MLFVVEPSLATEHQGECPLWVILDARCLSAARRLTVRSLSISCN